MNWKKLDFCPLQSQQGLRVGQLGGRGWWKFGVVSVANSKEFYGQGQRGDCRLDLRGCQTIFTAPNLLSQLNQVCEEAVKVLQSAIPSPPPPPPLPLPCHGVGWKETYCLQVAHLVMLLLR